MADANETLASAIKQIMELRVRVVELDRRNLRLEESNETIRSRMAVVAKAHLPAPNRRHPDPCEACDAIVAAGALPEEGLT